MNKFDLSFIIPALNEAEHIGGVLDAISENAYGRFKFEVIVVDNGSTDRTIEISKKRGAACLKVPGCTISTLRNIGANNAHSDILVFLDADVYLGKDWGEQIRPFIEKLCNQTNIVTGSFYGISEGNNWIERIWFAPRTTQKEVKYINGGHLILHKSLFKQIGGFDPELETGEDYEFCARAREMGALIENNPGLKVIHAGYPKSIKKFFGRERWHGRGDYKSLRTTFFSIPALISLMNLFVAVLCIIGTSVRPHSWIIFSFCYIFFLVFVSVISSAYRCKGRVRSDFLLIVILYIIYFEARTVSLVDVVVNLLFGRKRTC